MSNNLGTPERPLRVAVIGSGPSGFYAVDFLFKSELNIKVDMFERLPAPYGLVRYGVAPDHSKIKNVIKVYEKIAENENFSYLGNVMVGEDISVDELKTYYDALIFASGAETDRRLNIDGIDLPGSHTATEFVGWYNGHPDFQDRIFDLSCEVAVIVGQGNVAIDVARVLSKTVDELKTTDITQKALEILAESKIKEVHVYGRRGPAQAAFTPVEIREFGELNDSCPVINPTDLDLSEMSKAELEDPKNAPKKKNFGILQDLVNKESEGKSKKFVLHFKKSPIEIIGTNRVQKVLFEKNKLVGDQGQQKAVGTGEREEIDCGIFFRSIGYRGLPIKGLPFSDQAGVIPNTGGRVSDSEQLFIGLYASGWIKRGPSGIIGTNKPDSEETVKNLIADIEHLHPCKEPSTEKVLELLKEREVRVISFEDWKKIDAAEIERGQKIGKPREKFVKLGGMLGVL